MQNWDHDVAAIARDQHSVFTFDQALAAGFSPAQIRYRVRCGQWERFVPGVFGLAGVARTMQRVAMAAHLARPGSAISHLTAAVLAGIDVAAPPRPALTVPQGTSGRSAVATVHRLDLPFNLTCMVQGIRCTTPARTLVDCATVVGSKRLARLVDGAMHLQLTSAREVLSVLETTSHISCSRAADLAEHLEVWLPAIRPGSAAEARLLRQLAEWGLPRPDRQVPIVDSGGQIIARLDGGWPHLRLGYEYDSVQWHGPAAWASDEARHQMITELGWTLLHIDKADLRPGAHDLRDRLTAAYRRADADADARSGACALSATG